MTTHWCDFQNTDFILNIGSNSVENHPVSAKWLNKAHEKGATWIVVDPRYTRTAEMADIYCPIRSGTDIAFYGGLYKYICENLIDPNLEAYLEAVDNNDEEARQALLDTYNFEYLLNYTNSSYLLDPEFEFDVETGLFSGWDEETEKYNNHSWHYQTVEEVEWDTSKGGTYEWASHELNPEVPEFTPPVLTVPKKDATLSDEMCVYQQFKKHYSRYDMETVASTCGMTLEQLETVYSTYAQSGARGKAGVILYALGQTQHTYGAQNTRAMSILQLLLGNVGVPGGGVAALRGEPNVQGATDMGMMVQEQPAYLKWANTTDRKSLRAWLESQTYSDGYYTNKPKFIVSQLKEFFGENATVENDYGYDWWPKVPSHADAEIKDWTHISTFELMQQGVIKGYFNWGMNPCHSGPNAGNIRRSMANLDWLVVADQVLTEAAEFWRGPGMDPAKVNTTVYYLPCALIYEKPGTILNSGRWIQWRFQAVDPWDEAKTDLEMCDLLWTEICRLYEEEHDDPKTANPDPILNVKWDYYVDGKIDFRPVAWALNGYRVAGTNCNCDSSDPQTDLLSGYGELAADGSTSCGMWIYSGYYSNNEAPLDPASQPVCRRNNVDTSGLGLYSEWAFAWPNNRRILYNRASADMNGKPWREDRRLVEWDETEGKWKAGYADGCDVGDFVAGTTPPNNKAFFMLWEQNARLESYGMEDGPLPEHFEPFESPLDENPFNGRLNSPCYLGRGLESSKHSPHEEFPIVATTYSVTEHWQTGGQTRLCPALVEAMPAQFIEMSYELAAEKGIENGEKVRVWNNRASIEITALVTHRFKPFTVNGEKLHQVGMTHHFGWSRLFGTDQNMVNDLTPNVGDANSQTPEYKAFLVNIEKL